MKKDTFEQSAQKKEKHIQNPDILEGRNMVLEAIKARRAIDTILMVKGSSEGSIRQIRKMAAEEGLVIKEVNRSDLDRIANTSAHQGVIAYVAQKHYVELDDILDSVRRTNQNIFLIILDHVVDPHNLGSILRTASAVGVHGVIVPKRRAVGLNSVVAKSSAGAIEYVPVAKVANIAQTIEYLKCRNIWTVVADSEKGSTFYESDLKGDIALVVGGEGEGVSRLVKEKCDLIVNIPMEGPIGCLNASVAAAVIMYEIFKQRKM